MENKMKIVFFGTPHFVIPVLETLLTHYEVVAVVTAPDHFNAKKQQAVPSPIKAYYQQYYETHTSTFQHHPLQILTPQTFEQSLTRTLTTLNPDICVVAAYGKLIPKEVLHIPVLGFINIHPSLLPKYRGPSPIPAALINGDTVTGVTLIKMDEQLDHGPILTMEPVEILPTDTFESLAKRLFIKSAEMLTETIKDYAQGIRKPSLQDESKATKTKQITKADGYFDNDHPPSPIRLDRMIRAYFPWPGVWTKIKKENKEIRIKFLPDRIIQIEGGKPMSLKDLYNGYPQLKEYLEKLYT